MDDFRETEEFPGEKTRKFKIYDSNKNITEVDGTLHDALSTHPQLMRIKTYDVRQQLNLLYDDIEEGLFGEEAKTGKFASYIKSVKEQFPKN